MKTITTLSDDVELLLDDTDNVIFKKEDHVIPAIKNAVRELSTYCPQKTIHWATARNYSKNIDISPYEDLINVRYACYPVLLKNMDGDLIDDGDLEWNRRNVEERDAGTIRMKMDSSPKASVTDTLSGIVTFTSGSTAVSGASTAFTTELRVGYYIQPSDSTNWYRVASIPSDTGLVLASNVETADDGADTVDLTHYWRADVVLACDTEHYVTTQTDLTGAIDAGVAGGYAEGVWMIHVDALGTGTIDRGTLLTIAGCDGTYRVRSDATITANECDIYIEPALLDRAAENAVVTFRPSSLKAKQERLLAELTAANLIINLTHNAIDQVSSVSTDITNADTEYKLANPEVDQAVADADSGRALANTVPTGGGLNDYLGLVNGVMATSQGYLATASAALRQANARMSYANMQAALRNLGYERKRNAIMELKRMSPHKVMLTYARN